MDPSGNVYAIVPIDLILDTDIGLYRTIASKYRAEDVFNLKICDLDLDNLKKFSINRESENPLDAISLTPNEEANKDYYNQFMEQERRFILENSPKTSIYNFILNTISMIGINFTIWCHGELDKRCLIQSNPLFSKASFIMSNNYLRSIKEEQSSIYIKHYKDIIAFADKIVGKHLFIANYKFNFDINDRSVLDARTSILISPMITYAIFDVYNKIEETNEEVNEYEWDE